MARTKKTNVKDIFFTRTVDFSVMRFPVLNVSTMQGEMKEVKLPGKYDKKEAMLALVEKGYIPAGMPKIETSSKVLRWALSDIMDMAEEVKDVTDYVEGEEE